MHSPNLSFFVVEVDDLKGSLVFESSHSHNPSPALLQSLLVLHITYPEVDLSEVLSHFQTDSVHQCEHILAGRNVAQQDVLPQSVALGLLEAKHEGAALAVTLVFPHWLDAFLEKVDVGAHGELGGSFEVLIVGPEVFQGGHCGYWLKALLEGILSLHEVLVPELQSCRQDQLRPRLLHQISTIINRIKCSIINYAPMHAAPVPPLTPFLQKFRNKQQKVDRDGLIHLLHQEKQGLNSGSPSLAGRKSKPAPIRQAIMKGLNPQSLIKAETPMKQSSKAQKSIFISQQLKGSQSERSLENMAFHLSKRSDFKPFAENCSSVKLPPIGRSNSQNSKLISKEAFLPKLDMLESDRSHRKKESSGSFFSKDNDRASRQMQLDEFVLRHMQFLNKFQKQLISNRLSQGGKSHRE